MDKYFLIKWMWFAQEILYIDGENLQQSTGKEESAIEQQTFFQPLLLVRHPLGKHNRFCILGERTEKVLNDGETGEKRTVKLVVWVKGCQVGFHDIEPQPLVFVFGGSEQEIGLCFDILAK